MQFGIDDGREGFELIRTGTENRYGANSNNPLA